MILRLLYVGFAVEDVNDTRRTFKRLLGLPGEHMEPDSFLGTDRGARIAFPNQCWLYVMESQQPKSRIFRYMQQKGPGLERVAFLSDDIEAEFERVRRGGVPLSDDALAETPSGRRFVVPPEYVSGITVELFQPSAGHWIFDALANISGVLGLQHIGVAVRDMEATYKTFERLFELPPHDLRTDQHGGKQKDVQIMPGNDRLWLHPTQSWEENTRVKMFLEEKGEGLEHICIEVDDIREAVKRALGGECPFDDNPFTDNKIYTSRPDGFEAFICPKYTTGVTVELIEPFPFSRGYRERRGCRDVH